MTDIIDSTELFSLSEGPVVPVDEEETTPASLECLVAHSGDFAGLIVKALVSRPSRGDRRRKSGPAVKHEDRPYLWGEY